MLNSIIDFAERGWVPDRLIRWGIRRLLSQRLRALQTQDDQSQRDLMKRMDAEVLAVDTEAANQQHYEVPADFFRRVLGKRLKYSCGYFESPDCNLDQAEESMLTLTCQRAGIEDGQDILELGCGWGSLTLWLAEHFPNARITAISNSNSQREFIQTQLSDKLLPNANILTQDIRTFETIQKFDRIVSVEMFEHMRNYRQLFRRIASWLHPDGQLFAHIFCHRSSTYLFETQGAANWMGRHFFTGGTMPAENLFAKWNDDLTIQHQWKVGGMHYWRTCEEWLKRLDHHAEELHQLFSSQLGDRLAAVALQRWRIFMLACAELFRYQDGQEWFVAHYLLRPVASKS